MARYFWNTERCASSITMRSKWPTPKRRVPSFVSSISPIMVGYVETNTRPSVFFSVTRFTGALSGRCVLNALAA